ncbi:hypothetical protein Tco_1531568 [Tanacetum coccineum]
MHKLSCLSLEDKIELITELAKYPEGSSSKLRNIKHKQSKVAAKTDLGNFIKSVHEVGTGTKNILILRLMLKGNLTVDAMVDLWKLVKDRFKEDIIQRFEAPIKSWRLYKSCRVHCLIMKGMIIYMLDDVEYPLPKTTLQRFLIYTCEVSTACMKFSLLIEDRNLSESKKRSCYV